MRQFQKILHELKSIVANSKPGDLLTPPSIMPSIHIEGRRLSYAVMKPENVDATTSAAPAVIFLHGFGGFFMDWPRVMAPISRHTTVYALDLPGWGFSELNRNANSLEDDVSAVEEFMRQLGITSAILCGISYGAGVAWAAASMGVKGVKRAVLLNPMPPNPLDYMHSGLYQGVFALNLSRPTSFLAHKLLRKSQYKAICRENLLNDRLLDTFYLDLAYLMMKQPKMPFLLNAHARGAREINWSEWEQRLASTGIPVSILQGLDDRIFSLDSATYLYELIPNSELIEISDCGHAMVFDQHRKVSDFITNCVTQKSVKRSFDQSG
jgi:branched-chain amino acid transport system permease protein